jgi:hypothetical protein
VLGLSMLVVQMNHRLDKGATPATVLGPFHIEGSPELEYGADMSQGLPGTPLYVTGTVRDLDGKAVGGAVLDVWQADTDGAYEAQLDVDEARLRAKYISKGRRHLLRPDDRAARVQHPDGRPGRRPDRTDGHQPSSALRTSTSCSTCPATSR